MANVKRITQNVRKAPCKHCGQQVQWIETDDPQNQWVMVLARHVPYIHVGQEINATYNHNINCTERPHNAPKETGYRALRRPELIAEAHKMFPGIDSSRVMHSTNPMLVEALESNDPTKLGVAGDDIHGQQIAGGAAIDMDSVIAVLTPAMETKIAELIAEQRPQMIEVKFPDGTTKNIGRQHEKFPELVEWIMLNEHMMLKGDAGSGKSTGAENAFKALKRDYTVKSLGPQTTQGELLGYTDAQGRYVKGVCYDRFKNGGGMIFDEFDAMNPQTAVVINGMAACQAGQMVSFPTGEIGEDVDKWVNVARHPDFVIIACANTYGMGADAMYVGRAQLDAATLDRFSILEWGYDERLEREIAMQYGDMTEWVNYVQNARKAIAKGQRVVISPRATFTGAKALAAGFDRARVEQARLWGKMSTDDAAQIKARMGR